MKTVDRLAVVRELEEQFLTLQEQLRTLMTQVKQLQASVSKLEAENASVRRRLGATREGAEEMQ